MELCLNQPELLMTPLKLHKDGTLTFTDWVYDDKAGEGSYVSTKIQDTKYKTFLSALDKPVELEDGVTLSSFLELLASVDTDGQAYHHLFNSCWIRSFIDKYQEVKHTAVPYDVSDRDAIEYIKVHRTFYIDTVTGTTDYIISHGSISGVGVEQSEDYIQRNYVMWEKGSRIPWNISYTKLNTLLNIPVVLSEQVEFYEENHDIVLKQLADKIKPVPLLSFKAGYLLRDVIRDIFWELSWGGGPK